MEQHQRAGLIPPAINPTMPMGMTYGGNVMGVPDPSAALSMHPGAQMQLPIQPKFEPPQTDPSLATMKPASSLVVNWLLENYESEEGSSLPRSTLYTHYLQFCTQTNLESVNAASFGKLIRSVFPNLKTRRLGTRGHSKYHYYGIRLKPTSKLRATLTTSESNSLSNSSGAKASSGKEEEEEDEGSASPTSSLGASASGQGTTTTTTTTTSSSPADTPSVLGTNPMLPQSTTARGSKQLPEFGMPERSKLPSTARWDHVQTFALMYRTHCQQLIDTAAWHSFSEIETLLRHFWQGLPGHFKQLLVFDGLIDFLVERDALVYQSISEILVPDVLGPMPLSLPPLIRDFSRNFPEWLARAVDTLPAPLIQRKVAVATEFSVLLRKQATLNAMAASCRKVLSNVQHVTQMLHDWSRIDFHAIAHQSHWLCPAAHNISNSIQEDFRQFLQQRFGVEQWAHWLADVLNRFLMKCTDVRQLTLTSQQVLLKWSFYSSLVIRDLTLRNAPSLGSFHLLRTLFEAYLGYLVDLRMQAHKARMPYIPGHSSSLPPTSLPAFPSPHTPSTESATSTSSTPAAPAESDTAETFSSANTAASSAGTDSSEVPPLSEDESNRGSNKHFLAFPPAESDRPLKQRRTDAPESESKPGLLTLPPSGSSFSSFSSESGLLPPTTGGFVAPKALPQAQGSFLLTPTEWAGVMPGGSMNFGSMGSMSMTGNLVSPRKPSFGSFGSFSTEFRCLMRSSSFDRVRGSFERRDGAPPASPSPLDADSPWQHIFYNLSTPHISFQSFAFAQDDPSQNKDASAASTTTTASSFSLPTNTTVSTIPAVSISSASPPPQATSTTGATPPPSATTPPASSQSPSAESASKGEEPVPESNPVSAPTPPPSETPAAAEPATNQSLSGAEPAASATEEPTDTTPATEATPSTNQ